MAGEAAIVLLLRAVQHLEHGRRREQASEYRLSAVAVIIASTEVHGARRRRVYARGR